MKKWTLAEFRAYRAAREERMRALRAHVERVRAELEAKRREKPA